jgi:type VI secretion system secreted protein VgrG
LGTAADFSVLAGSTATNTGPSTLEQKLGVHPGSTAPGFTAEMVPAGIHLADDVAAQAKSDLTTAYNDAAGRTPFTNEDNELGGETLTAGVYRIAAAELTGQLTLDLQSNPDAVFIFQIDSTLITAANSSVIFVNGSSPCNVYWQVGSSATLGTGTDFVGNIMAAVSITMNNGADLEGRALAQTGAVTMDTNDITTPECAPDVPPTSDEPTTDQPTTDQPTTDEPTTDEPTTDQPTTDQPTTDQPTTDQPTTDQPTTDQPTTDQPTTDQPTTDQPTTDQPTTDQPTTDEPTTDQPTTDEPTTDQPTTDQPTTDQPTTDQPTTDQPTTDQPTTDQPTTDQPTTDQPTTGGPTDGPTTGGPTDGPTTGGPTDGPTTDGPTDGPTTDGPTDGPTTDGPTDGPTTQGPTKDRPDTRTTSSDAGGDSGDGLATTGSGVLPAFLTAGLALIAAGALITYLVWRRARQS